MSLLKHKTAIITGAANGIGAYFTSSFLQQGAKVIACDLDVKQLEKLYKNAPNCTIKQLDVRNASKWETLFNDITQLDYLLNIAGVIKPGFLGESSIESIDLTIDVNLKGTMFGCKFAAEKMANKGGHIINFASMAGIAPVQGLSTYVASKFGVRGFSLAIAQELKKQNIVVSVIAPDATDTNMLDDQMNSKAAALTFSGDKILTTQDVWNEVYEAVIIGKKAELWIPFSRGMQAYLGATFPKAAGWLTNILSKKGLKAQKEFRENRNKKSN